MSDIVELKVTSRKPYTFYLRSAKHFVEGTKVKAPVEKITVSALGNAIPAAITIASKLEQEESATIENVTTGFPTLDGKDGAAGKPCAQIKIVLKRTGKVTTPMESQDAPDWEMAERLKDAKLEKKMKKVIKEGGKRGVEIEGAADMGGLQFFCTAVEEPGSDIDMLVECMKAMNAKSDPSEEERKGGSGHVGKLLFSQTDKAVAIMTYVPKAKLGEIKANEWLSHVAEKIAAGTKIEDRSTQHAATVTIECNKDKGLFAIKMKDTAIQEGINYLKERGLFPDKDDDSEDEMVFGDDDFPM